MDHVVMLRPECHRATEGTSVRLAPGASASFGACRCDPREFDIVLEADDAHRSVAGAVQARDDHWNLTNIGAARLIVENLAQPVEYFAVPAGTRRSSPFESARIRWRQECAGFTVLGRQDARAPRASCAARPGVTVELNRSSAYFAVLAAFCAPRQRHGPGSPLPTTKEVAGQLARRGLALTPRAVDAQVDYLIEKLRLGVGAAGDRLTRGWKREALVAYALRWGLVDQP